MGVTEDLRKRWFVTALLVASSLFFTGALVFSTLTYVDVMQAREGVELRDAVETAEELEDGTLRVTFSIEVHNPSDMELVVQSLSWTVRVDNSTTTSQTLLPVADAYNGTSDGIVFPGESVRTVTFEAVVTDEARLAALRGYAAFASSDGEEVTLSTIEYVHDFRLVAWTGGLDHDYQYYKEMYLNDIVRIERSYYGGEYL